MESPKNKKCNICGNYYHNEYLRKHIRTIHEGKREHKCAYCLYRFSYHKDLKKTLVQYMKVTKTSYANFVVCVLMTTET